MNENRQSKKIVSANRPMLRTNNNNELYSKKYYVIFFVIMLITFFTLLWLCNETKLKEMFQLIALSALSIAIAEYAARSYFKK